jgi:hypothetical protein
MDALDRVIAACKAAGVTPRDTYAPLSRIFQAGRSARIWRTRDEFARDLEEIVRARWRGISRSAIPYRRRPRAPTRSRCLSPSPVRRSDVVCHAALHPRVVAPIAPGGAPTAGRAALSRR